MSTTPVVLEDRHLGGSAFHLVTETIGFSKQAMGYGCLLGLGLVEEDKHTEFLCSQVFVHPIIVTYR